MRTNVSLGEPKLQTTCLCNDAIRCAFSNKIHSWGNSSSPFQMNEIAFSLANDTLTCIPRSAHKHNTRSVQKTRGLFELRGSGWFQENPLGIARLAQIS